MSLGFKRLTDAHVPLRKNSHRDKDYLSNIEKKDKQTPFVPNGLMINGADIRVCYLIGCDDNFLE